MSDISQPSFYDLEFSSDVLFWTEEDVGSRRTFFMPMPNPLQFLAFGVLAPSNQVRFVARGAVRDNLGAFIARMGRDTASVELYARAPVPEDLLQQYGAGLPFETQVLLPPPPPNGPSRPPEDVLASLWREGDATTRRTFLMPLSDPASFIAFGVLSTSDTPHFVARGSVRNDLLLFTDRMVQDNASVELYARAPLPESVLSQYISDRSLAFAPELLKWPSATEFRFEALRA